MPRLTLSPRELAAHHHNLAQRIAGLPAEVKADYAAAVERGDKDAAKNPIARWQQEMHAAVLALAVLPGVSDRMVGWRVEIGGPVDEVNQFRFKALVERIQRGDANEQDRTLHDALIRGVVPGDKISEPVDAWLSQQEGLTKTNLGVGKGGWHHEFLCTKEQKERLIAGVWGEFRDALADGRMHLRAWTEDLFVLPPEEYPEAWPWS